MKIRPDLPLPKETTIYRGGGAVPVSMALLALNYLMNNEKEGALPKETKGRCLLGPLPKETTGLWRNLNSSCPLFYPPAP